MPWDQTRDYKMLLAIISSISGDNTIKWDEIVKVMGDEHSKKALQSRMDHIKRVVKDAENGSPSKPPTDPKKRASPMLKKGIARRIPRKPAEEAAKSPKEDQELPAKRLRKIEKPAKIEDIFGDESE